MSHRHFCVFRFHGWGCEGKALRSGDREPSVCLCPACELPLEEGDHSRCLGPIEVITCQEHRDEERLWRIEMKPRFAAHIMRRKAERDQRLGSTPESDQAFERLLKNLGSEPCQRAFIYGHSGWEERPGNHASPGVPDAAGEGIRQERGNMRHRHFCDVAGHWWDCNGVALRLGQKLPTVCVCHACRLPLAEGDHGRCKSLVEIVACPEHRDEQQRRREEAEKDFERRAAEFGFEQKWARMKSLPVGPEKDALAEEIVKWLFR